MSDEESVDEEPALGHTYWIRNSSVLFDISVILGLIDGALMLSAPQMAVVVSFFGHLMWKRLSVRIVAAIAVTVLLLQANLSYFASIPMATQFISDNYKNSLFLLEMFGLAPDSSAPEEFAQLKFTLHLWVDALIVGFGVTSFKMSSWSYRIRSQSILPIAGTWKYVWRYQLLPPGLLLVCQSLALSQVFLYHDVPSLMILIWILHSVIDECTARFARLTQRIYLPAAIIISVYYYATNLNGIRESPIAEKGVKFQHSFIEVILMELMIFFTVAWTGIQLRMAAIFPTTSCEESDDVCLRFVQHMSSKKRNTFVICVFLIIPWFEMAFLSTILLLGMNRVDVYHLVFMLFFISLAMLPHHRNRLTRLLIIYTGGYILGNYILQLVGIPD
mmetsp:Transcript_10288/g.15689  ORF Transcript_10288/g.15689 Transcript_10288/m.15689 type:complete len:389 (+) Transcript_10288:912-2078(+)